MSWCANIQMQPILSLSRRSGQVVAVLVDEAGRVLSDEADNILQPDPQVAITAGDENNVPLKDEDNNLLTPDP